MKRLWIAVLVLALDRASKLLAAGLDKTVTLVPGLLQLHYTENRGAAFSMLSDTGLLLPVVSVLLLFAGWLVLRKYRLGPLNGTAAMLILGGAVGNLLDRVIRGCVPDMIEITAFQFAVFNVADAALTIGCVFMAVSLLWHPEEWRTKTDG